MSWLTKREGIHVSKHNLIKNEKVQKVKKEGPVPKMRIWSMLLIKSDLKWCIHLSRSLFLYYERVKKFHFVPNLQIWVTHPCRSIGCIYFFFNQCSSFAEDFQRWFWSGTYVAPPGIHPWEDKPEKKNLKTEPWIPASYQVSLKFIKRCRRGILMYDIKHSSFLLES